MTRHIRDLDVPLPALRQQIRDLIARQREAAAEQAADRLRDLLAPTPTNPHAKDSTR